MILELEMKDSLLDDVLKVLKKFDIKIKQKETTKDDLISFFRNSPLVDEDISFERDKETYKNRVEF